MSKALSMDLRVRVLAAVSQGLSHRAVADAFRGEHREHQWLAQA